MPELLIAATVDTPVEWILGVALLIPLSLGIGALIGTIYDWWCRR